MRSIKSSEREIRGQAETFVIQSPDIRIPPDLKNFSSIMEPTKNDCLSLLKMFGKERQQLLETELSILRGNVLV